MRRILMGAAALGAVAVVGAPAVASAGTPLRVDALASVQPDIVAARLLAISAPAKAVVVAVAADGQVAAEALAVTDRAMGEVVVDSSNGAIAAVSAFPSNPLEAVVIVRKP